MNHLNELLVQVNSSNQEMEGKMREGKYLYPHIASALKSNDYVLSVRGLSHYEGTLISREKNFRSGQAFSYEKRIFWIFREIVLVPLG
jgi:hypothetical protein